MEEIISNLHNIIDRLKKTKIIILILIINIIFIIGIIYFTRNREQNDYNLENYIALNTNETDTKIEENKKIVIYITGEINNSGVYELDENSRISDAIEIAGGLTSNANIENINLAFVLSDGQKIKIPSINNEKNGNTIIEDDENAIIENNESKDKKININTASISELTTISGIGETTAQKIIDYRNDNGKFKDIQEIKNVSGIGDSKYNLIKDYIKVK